MTDENLLWHVLLPRGVEAYDPSQRRWDSARRLITVGYTNRLPVMVTFDGFLIRRGGWSIIGRCDRAHWLRWANFVR